MANKIKADWDAVETEYCKGILSNHALAAIHGISEAAIRKKAKERGWIKDLKEKIRLATDRKVREKVRESAHGKQNEQNEIEIAAETQATIIIAHRKDIQKSRTIGTKLFMELEDQTDNVELYAQLGELMQNPGSSYDKLNDIYRKVTAMPGRVDAFKKLTDSLKTTIGLERQAFGLADNANGEADKPKERMVFNLSDYNL